MSPQQSSEQEQINDGKIFAILSYLSIFCIIPLLFKKDNKFVLAHSKQGLVIFVGEVAIFIVQIVFGAWALKLGLFVLGVLSFMGIIAVLKGEYIKIPLVFDIAEKIIL